MVNFCNELLLNKHTPHAFNAISMMMLVGLVATVLQAQMGWISTNSMAVGYYVGISGFIIFKAIEECALWKQNRGVI